MQVASISPPRFTKASFPRIMRSRSGAREDSVSALPSYARSPNHIISTSSWLRDCFARAGVAANASDGGSARVELKVPRVVTLWHVTVLCWEAAFETKFPATIDEAKITLIQDIETSSCLLTLRSAQDPISWLSSRIDARESWSSNHSNN